MSKDRAAALAYALTGEVVEVGSAEPDAVLAAVGGVDRVVAIADRCRTAGQVWPWPVDRPDNVGPAQWAALLTAATARVRERRTALARRVGGVRPPDTDERRLLADVPPHHLG